MEQLAGREFGYRAETRGSWTLSSAEPPHGGFGRCSRGAWRTRAKDVGRRIPSGGRQIHLPIQTIAFRSLTADIASFDRNTGERGGREIERGILGRSGRAAVSQMERRWPTSLKVDRFSLGRRQTPRWSV